MKYMRQFGIILGVTCAGELMKYFIPLMFIPAGVGLMASWGELQGFLVPLLVITVSTTFIVIFVTGKVTDFMMDRKEKTSRKNRKVREE